MNHFPHLRHAAASDIGRKRKNNEDSFGVFPAAGLYCVADGMGGGDDGEVASAATVRAVESYVQAHPLPDGSAYPLDAYIGGLRAAVNEASAWIARRARQRNLKGCGSTFVGICFDAANPGEAAVLHAGDSRLYRLRGRSIQQVTRDHSAAELIGAKSESEINPMFRGMILRAVGIMPSVELERTPLSVRAGDRILICSDGLSRMVPDKRILSLVRRSETPDEAVQALIAAANAAGGIDNVTVELIEVGPLPAALPVAPMAQAAETAPTQGGGEIETVTCDTRRESVGSSDFVPGSVSGSGTAGREADPPTCPAMVLPEEDRETVRDTETEESDTEDRTPERPNGRRRFTHGVLVGCAAAGLLGVVALLGWLHRRGDSADEAAREAEAMRLEEAAQRKAEAEREAARLAEEARRAAEEAARRQEEAARRLEEEARKKAEAEREAARLAEEARRAAEEAARRQEEEARHLEEEARKKAEAEREAARLVEEARRAAEEAARRQEEEARRLEEEARKKAEAEREAARLAEEARRAAEEAARRQEEEARRLEEEGRKKAEAEREAARRRQAERAFRELADACDTATATNFVRKARDLVPQSVPGSVYGRLKAVREAADFEAGAGLAADLTRDIQAIASSLLASAAGERDDLLNTPPLQDEEARHRVRVAALTDFIDHVGQLGACDASEPLAQSLAAKVMRELPVCFP